MAFSISECFLPQQPDKEDAAKNNDSAAGHSCIGHFTVSGNQDVEGGCGEIHEPEMDDIETFFVCSDFRGGKFIVP